MDNFYTSEAAAINAALNSKAIELGNEIFVFKKGSQYVVTETPEVYRDWTEVRME